MQTEPEQWVVELRSALWNELGHDPKMSKALSAYGMARFNQLADRLIQRAFEDQTRKLREQLARYEGGAGPDDWRECPGQCGESCCGYHDACRQALKETPDAQ